MGVIISASVVAYDGNRITASGNYADTAFLMKHSNCHCEIWLRDGREISPKQRNKIFAIVGDITEWMSGFDKKRIAFHETLRQMQLNYILEISPENIRRQLTQHYCQLCGIDFFSLAERRPDTVDMTTAREFIDWLVELCIKHRIPCTDTLLNRCEDVGRYLYACLANKCCCLCGAKADLHHVDAVGAGRDRRTIIHEGMEALPLCRIHHKEAHTIGVESFCEKYHVFGIKLDGCLCSIWKLKTVQQKRD